MRQARTWGPLTVASTTVCLAASLLGQSDEQRKDPRAAQGPRMSAMAVAAANVRSRLASGREPLDSLREDCVNDPRCSAGFRDDPAGTLDAEYLDLEFDVCYDTEEDPNFNVLAYDGFFLRVADLTPGRTLRSLLAEAFADEFTTGPLLHYPRHLPRNDDVNYFQDMSAWAGFSNGLRHVRMRLPGVAGSRMQLRFEYTQDALFTCENIRGRGRTCGVFLDNVVVKSVRSQRRQAE